MVSTDRWLVIGYSLQDVSLELNIEAHERMEEINSKALVLLHWTSTHTQTQYHNQTYSTLEIVDYIYVTIF